ncbi:MAG: 3-methyl-2-oxobutanoate dehydrogenase subunit VorB [Endomicrobiia bacterium]|nr:3-methyl-2-oxobutanoate dehydrogenase subunit VorB [Endomicrobiia bacterium]
MKGNIAVCEGALAGGLDAYYGYPITPQNEVPEYMSRKLPALGKIFIQAESELASINMVMGTAVAGFRAMTSSSSPGISLMQEGISYLAGCELPCLIVNVQRGGPGLGNISGSQGDYFQATKGGGHGDYRLIVFSPASVQEMYDLARSSFAIAEKYRNPVMILTDGVSGQMMEPILIEDDAAPSERAASTWALDGCRGREPRLIRSLLMAEGALERHNLDLDKKYARIKKNETRCETFKTDDAEVIIVATGIAARIAMAAVNAARAQCFKVGLIRPVTLWPFPDEVIRAAADGGGNNSALRPKNFLVVELNLGQMVEDVRLAVDGKVPVSFLGRPGGGLPTIEEISAKIRTLL